MEMLDLELFHKTVSELWGAKKYKDYEDKHKQDRLVVEALEPYSIHDICQALRVYWKYKSDKTKPTIQKIIAILETTPDIEKETKGKKEAKVIISEWALQHIHEREKYGLKNEYLHSVYVKALNEKINQWWDNYGIRNHKSKSKLSYSFMFNQTKINGLLNDFEGFVHDFANKIGSYRIQQTSLEDINLKSNWWIE